jgi:hypothetical protein
MMQFIEQARRFLWAFVELAFLSLVAIILVYLILGQESGSFVQSVADNVMKFAGGVPTPSLIGLAIIGMLVYAITQKMKA